MSRFAKPLQFIEVTILLAAVIFAWPTTINCSAPFQTCAPAPNQNGEIIYPTTTTPFAIILLENWLQTDLDIAYKTGTRIERPVVLPKDNTASPSANMQSQPTTTPN
jgi:hypothetical protein